MTAIEGVNRARGAPLPYPQGRDSAQFYPRLLELWSDADAELQPQVEAVRRPLDALSGRGGAAQAPSLQSSPDASSFFFWG
jgi:hypothetical protein